MLFCLSHNTISSSYNKDSTIHLSSTCDHVLYIVGMSWAVNVSIMTFCCLVLNVSCRDCDTTFSFFWSFIDVFEIYLFRYQVLFLLSTLVIAAVKVVLPWSTCPIVPILQCGLLLSNLALAILTSSFYRRLIPRSGEAYFYYFCSANYDYIAFTAYIASLF